MCDHDEQGKRKGRGKESDVEEMWIIERAMHTYANFFFNTVRPLCSINIASATSRIGNRKYALSRSRLCDSPTNFRTNMHTRETSVSLRATGSDFRGVETARSSSLYTW